MYLNCTSAFYFTLHFVLSLNKVSNMKVKETGFNIIDKSAKELFDLSSYLHMNPELAFKEFKAHDYICTFLEERQFQVKRNFILETGFLATYETAPAPHLVIMVEMDALPEIGHACGHNLIAECSVAAGLGLLETMKIHNLKGKLSLLGTPAEEDGGGKIRYVSEGFFKDVDVAIMCHPSMEDLAHKTHLAVASFKVAFEGKEAHASCSPWIGLNALDAAVLAYQSVSCLRQQTRPECRIMGIITNGGIASNIIPHYTEMVYEIRAPTIHEVNNLTPKILSCFHGAGQSTGCNVKVSSLCPPYEDVISNKGLVNLFQTNATELGIVMDKDDGLSDGSTDVGNVSHVCPTIQPLFFIGTKFDTHTKEYALETGKEEVQKYVLRQAKAIVGTLIDILTDKTGGVLKEIKFKFLEDIK